MFLDCKEKYFGCDCRYLGHIARMSYFKPCKDEEDVVYFTIQTTNYLNRFAPSLDILPSYWFYNFKEYLRYNILRRIPIALCYIFNKYYEKKYGLFDHLMFQNKDLFEMKEILSAITNEEVEIKKDEIISWNDEEWQIRFSIDSVSTNKYWINPEFQFIPRKIFGRIKWALKYIFGIHDSNQLIIINKEIAKKIKGMITTVEKLNKGKKDG